MKTNIKKQDSDFASMFSNSGELERNKRIKVILNLKAQKILINDCINQKEAENSVRSMNKMVNVNDGRITEIPVNTIGKILRHKGYDISKIFNYIFQLYENAVYGWSEQEIIREGHKLRSNIKEFHHYINKFSDGTCVYFIRFTLSELKARPGKTGKNMIHSTAISKVDSYKNGDGSQRIRGIYPGGANSSPFLDYRLAEFLNPVK